MLSSFEEIDRRRSGRSRTSRCIATGVPAGPALTPDRPFPTAPTTTALTATAFQANPITASIPDRPLVPSLVYCPTCCRLQQPTRAGCASCGAAASSLRDFDGDLASLAPGRAGHAVRYPGDTRFVARVAASFAILLSLAVLTTDEHESPLLFVALFAGIGTAALVDTRRAARVAQGVRQVPPPAAALAAAAPHDRAIAGVAHPLERFVDAPLARCHCLAVRLDIRAGIQDARRRIGAGKASAGVQRERGMQRDGDVAGPRDLVAQWLDAAEFVVTTTRGARALVTGVIYLDAAEYDAAETSERIDIALHGQPVLPAALGGDGWACELALEPGDRVEIQGRSTGEVRVAPAGALYRDAGALAVIRGVPGDPVIVRVRRR